MAKSHRLLFDQYVTRRFARWARNAVASLVLLACVVSLSIILHNHYGALLTSGVIDSVGSYAPSHSHPLGGEKMAFEPEANIMVGARILTEYLRRTGDLRDALQMYVGATSEENEYGYSIKVMTERDRLKLVLRQYQSRTAL